MRNSCKAGGPVKKKKYADGGPIPEDPNSYRMFKKGIFGKYKIKDISKEKFDRINNRLSRDTDNTKYGSSSSPREGISKEGIGQREVSVGRVSKQLIKANQEKANRAAQENVKIANEAARAELKKQYEDSLRKSKPTIMKKSGGSTKKKYEAGGGVIPSKPVMTAPMQGRLGNRPVAGGNMAKGGPLKDVPAGKTGTPPMSTKEALGKVFTGEMTADQAKAATGYVPKPDLTPQQAAQFRATLKEKLNAKSTMKGGGGVKHQGFKAVQEKIAKKQGLSKKAAGAILAAGTRKASAKAKAANPRLKRVKG